LEHRIPRNLIRFSTAWIVAALVAGGLLASQAASAQEFITVASTTSTEQSGLFRHLLPEAKKATGVEVRVVALGTGQAL